MEFTMYHPESGEAIAIPYRWELCDSCEGEGKRALGGVSFTASEWHEWTDGDPDVISDYLSGGYDTICGECQGTGKVSVAASERMSEAMRTEYEAQESAYRANRAEERAEAQYFGYY